MNIFLKKALIPAGLAVFCLVEGLILTGFRRKDPRRLPLIIVLGAHIRKDGPCRTLRYRLDRAVDYLRQYPDTVCIVSGGQGPDEPCSEAYAMKQYLLDRGIEEERIIPEDRSRTTRENILYSMKIMEERGLAGGTGPAANNTATGLVTNDFHMYRALKIAGRCGLVPVEPVTASSSRLYLPKNMLREFFALIKYFAVP